MNLPTLDEAMVLTGAISSIHILHPDECAAMYEVLCLLPDGATVAEVGCDQGRSSSLISQVASAKHFLTIHVDPWQQFPERAREWMENICERCQYHPFIVLRMTTVEAAAHIERLTPQGIDLAFIDGCHDQDVVEKDMRIVATRVNSGGFLAAHDYPSGGVTEAIDGFIALGGWSKYSQTAPGFGVWRKL